MSAQDQREEREIAVGEEWAGTRLDVFLARELALTRGYVRRLLSRDRVRLAGRVASKGDLLRPGDVVVVEAFRHPDDRTPRTSARPIAQLAASDDFLAFDKPAGLPSQPLDFEEGDTAVGRVLAMHAELAGIGTPLECGLVHRLDVQTSGVLVFARSARSWIAARRAFAQREVDKCYRALVHGKLVGRERVTLRIEHRGKRMRVVSTGGQPVELDVEGVDTRGEASLVDVRPRTGAMHQIRVALAELGHPIVGDGLYGSPAVEPRHWLHASELRLGAFVAHAPLPPELR